MAWCARITVVLLLQLTLAPMPAQLTVLGENATVALGDPEAAARIYFKGDKTIGIDATLDIEQDLTVGGRRLQSIIDSTFAGMQVACTAQVAAAPRIAYYSLLSSSQQFAQPPFYWVVDTYGGGTMPAGIVTFSMGASSWTLSGNNTYRLTANPQSAILSFCMAYNTGTSTPWAVFQWKDMTHNVLVGQPGSYACTGGASSHTSIVSNNAVTYVVAPQNVTFQVSVLTSVAVLNTAQGAFVTVEELTTV